MSNVFVQYLESATGTSFSMRISRLRVRRKRIWLDKSGWWKSIYAFFLLCAATGIPSPAQTFTTLLSLNGKDGANPNYGALVQGFDGDLYGTTEKGGSTKCTAGCGTVFKITPTGTLTTLHSFDSADGAIPLAGLVLATDGIFYGTTELGGTNGHGTVFKISPSGTLTTLHSFAGSDGIRPAAGLVQGSDGNLYGATTAGGNTTTCSIGTTGCGTIFKITPSGVFTTLHRFSGPDGVAPSGTLVQVNGTFYGTTGGGGATRDGTVFKMSPSGTVTTLHSFNNADGRDPLAGLVVASNGTFYGTTVVGGAKGFGTVFKMTLTGTLTTLHSFLSTDGADPTAGLVQATDGNLYGTTEIGGSGYGTVFKITQSGTLTTLHKFSSTGGANPVGGLAQATNGKLYGTTANGADMIDCSGGCGTMFTLAVGLGAFVETMPTSGKVGVAVKILGTNLTSAANVSFNGTRATFTVASGTEITTSVPAGAMTGFVTVTTPSGTLKSNKIFLVTPQITSFSPISGAPGTAVTITGVSLKQTTKVTFGGVAAAFTVNSDSKVTATVPTGAKTGKIAITTPGGTAISSGTFTVALPSPLAITSGAPPSGTVGKLYDFRCLEIPPCNVFVAGFPLSAAGGVQPYSWSWVGAAGSSTPPGLGIGGACLNDPAPTICGTPKEAGSFSVVVTVRDSESPAMQQSANYTIVINP